MEGILRILEQDPRISTERIAAMLGIGSAEVEAQVAEWERTGVIRRYKTVIDWELVGRERVMAFIDVSVTPERGVGFDEIAERVYRFPEVRSVYLVSGGHDLRLVVVGDSMKAIAAFVSDKLAVLDRVTATMTQFVLKRYKEDGDVFAETEGDQRLVVTP